MSFPEAGNTLAIPAYSSESEQASMEISWSQSLRTKKARYYIVRAKNLSKDNADVLLYVQDNFYKDESSADYIGKLPGARKEGGQSSLSLVFLSQPHEQYSTDIYDVAQTSSSSTSMTASSTVRRTRPARVAGSAFMTRARRCTRLANHCHPLDRETTH